MAKYDNTLCYTEVDTREAPFLCVWCREAATIRCACGMVYCSQRCQEASDQFGHQRVCNAIVGSELPLHAISVDRFEIPARFLPWIEHLRPELLHIRRWELVERLVSAGMSKRTMAIAVAMEHGLAFASFAVDDLSERDALTEVTMRGLVRVIHASALAFAKEPRAMAMEKKYGSAMLVLIMGVVKGLRRGTWNLHVDTVLMRQHAGVSAVDVCANASEATMEVGALNRLDPDMSTMRTVDDYFVDSRKLAKSILLEEHVGEVTGGARVKSTDADKVHTGRNLFRTRRVV